MRPDARRERLLIEEVGDELVVYDLERHRVHQLNRTAALVWQCCDGHQTVAELGKLLQDQVSPAVSEAIVWQALDQLGKARLLRNPVTRPVGAARMTRRQALSRFGQTAALALLLPAVTSIIAPAPLRADGQDDDVCEEGPCHSLCKNLCRSDRDCHKPTPFCRLVACQVPSGNNNATKCRRCSQKRCVKSSTASQIGGGGD
jgi:hypothetical protein